jgi:hypothetical protein
MSLREENEEEKKRREIEERREGIYKQGAVWYTSN